MIPFPFTDDQLLEFLFKQPEIKQLIHALAQRVAGESLVYTDREAVTLWMWGNRAGILQHDPNRDQDQLCMDCNHPYYRHFNDDDMWPVGCKYCGCYTFRGTQPLLPEGLYT